MILFYSFLAISSSWSISSSIIWYLRWTWKNIKRTYCSWPSIWFKLDNTSTESRWNYRLSTLWTQRTTRYCMEFCWKPQCHTNSTNKKSPYLRRLSYVINQLFIFLFSLLFFIDRSTKLIAAIRQCEIIARDANRIHHFYTNGQCSCNDYFWKTNLLLF
jgi:hypothetical protein